MGVYVGIFQTAVLARHVPIHTHTHTCLYYTYYHYASHLTHQRGYFFFVLFCSGQRYVLRRQNGRGAMSDRMREVPGQHAVH